MTGLVKSNAYGASTVTVDQAMPTLHLTLSPKEKVTQLLKLMEESSLFPPSALEKWKEESLAYFDDPQSDEAGKVLSYLLIDLIDPMFNDQTSEKVLDQVLNIRDELVKVLKGVLPKEVDAEAFIKERKFNHKKIQLFVDKILIENACTGQSEANLYGAGEELNQKNTAGYEAMKGDLAKVKAKRDVCVVLAKEALNENEKMLYKTSNDLTNILDTSKMVSQKMQAAAETFEKQRQQCLNNARAVTKL